MAGDFEFDPVAPYCGADVRGLDLAADLDGGTVDRMRRALAEYGVLFFRNQTLTPGQLRVLGARFGTLHIHPTWPRPVAGYPELMEIYADADSTRIAGEQWHSDVSCDKRPPLGSILYMVETPPAGGDTLFAGMYAAYEGLSAPLRRFLAGLTAVHDGEQVYRRGYGQETEPGAVFPHAEHPVVRTHPLSGRKALFVNRTFTSHIAQLRRSESDALLSMLYAHCEQPLFQCRFRWEEGSVAFWDNRCVQHHALWDYYPHRRLAWRVTIEGEEPV